MFLWQSAFLAAAHCCCCWPTLDRTRPTRRWVGRWWAVMIPLSAIYHTPTIVRSFVHSLIHSTANKFPCCNSTTTCFPPTDTSSVSMIVFESSHGLSHPPPPSFPHHRPHQPTKPRNNVTNWRAVEITLTGSQFEEFLASIRIPSSLYPSSTISIRTLCGFANDMHKVQLTDNHPLGCM